MTDQVLYIVGDIHGCYDAFLELEKQLILDAAASKMKPLILCVGDLVDRGPDSFKVIKHFAEGYKKKTHLCLMGNHEQEFLRAIESYGVMKDRILPMGTVTIKQEFVEQDDESDWDSYRNDVVDNWVSQGGKETLNSFGLNEEKPESWRIDDELVEFLSGLQYFWENSSVIVSHALCSQRDIDIVKRGCLSHSEEDSDLIASMVLSVNSLLWNRRLPVKRPFPGQLHVSGHTPLKNVRYSKDLGLLQLDTGCVYGGKLTAFRYDVDQFFSVDSNVHWER